MHAHICLVSWVLRVRAPAARFALIMIVVATQRATQAVLRSIFRKHALIIRQMAVVARMRLAHPES